MFDFVNAIDPKLRIGITIGVIVSILVGWYFDRTAQFSRGEDSKQNEWLMKLANNPVKRDTLWHYDTIPGKTQYLKGDAILDTSGQMALMQVINNEIDEINRLRDSLHQGGLTAQTTLRDSLGGTHEITYYFGPRQFDERYTPSERILQLMTIRERQELPYELQRVWTAGLSFEYHREPGFGVLAGVKPLELGVSYFPGTQSFNYRVQVGWTW